MYIKVQAKFKAEQLLDLEQVKSSREIDRIEVDSKGIDVYLKDGSQYNFPIEHDKDPTYCVWEVAKYKPLEDTIVQKKPKRKPKQQQIIEVVESVDDDIIYHKDDPDPFD